MDRVQQAETVFTKVSQWLTTCQHATTALETDRARAQAEFDKLEALDQVTPDHVAAAENLQRRIRKRDQEIVAARDAVTEAQKARSVAERDVTAAKRETVFDELVVLDEDFIADVKATATRLGEKLAAFLDKKTEVHAFDWDLDPAPGAHQRESFNLLTSLAGDEPALLAAQKVLVAIAVRENPHAVRTFQTAPEGPVIVGYRPPRNENGIWDSPNPEPPTDAVGGFTR